MPRDILLNPGARGLKSLESSLIPLFPLGFAAVHVSGGPLPRIHTSVGDLPQRHQASEPAPRPEFARRQALRFREHISPPLSLTNALIQVSETSCHMPCAPLAVNLQIFGTTTSGHF
jgi:hypothetical protein